MLRLGQNFTPSVLFAHMYYHAAILLLFRPFIKLRFIGSSVSPQDVCSQSAAAVAALVRSFKELYTLRRIPAFVPYLVLTSSIVHLADIEGPQGAGQFLQAIGDLKEMSVCHGFARRSLMILKWLAKHWGLHLPKHEDDENEAIMTDADTEEEMESVINPHSRSMNLFCPSLGFLAASGLGSVQVHRNVVFSPFPMQGQPLLASGTQLNNDGFEVIEDDTEENESSTTPMGR